MKQQRINLKNIQATPATQFQKNKQPNQNMGQRPKQTFLQRRHQIANQNHNEVPSHASQNGCDPKVYKQ